MVEIKELQKKTRLLLLLLFLLLLLLLLLCAVKKRMYAKIEPHRARSVTYAMLRNYKKKTAELRITKK